VAWYAGLLVKEAAMALYTNQPVQPNDPRLTKLDQRRLIEERDAYRARLAELQRKYDTLLVKYNAVVPDLDNLE
jgi:hypothetical protein